VGLETRSATVRGEALYHSQPWYRAYMSALFESNTALIAVRIVLAQRLIAARELELFNLRTGFPRVRALNRALLALRALAACRKTTAPRRQDGSRPRPLRPEPDISRSNPPS
jgi:hypothetical protein